MARDETERQRIQSAHDVYLGVDVGKSFHWACALMGGEAVVDRKVANARDDVRAAMGEAIGLAGDLGVLVTVDQRNNIGALVVREKRAMGCDVAYLPGISEKRARDMFPGIAKDDRLDAWVIAHTSEASPQALLPVPDSRATRLLGSQRRHRVKLATQASGYYKAILETVPTKWSRFREEADIVPRKTDATSAGAPSEVRWRGSTEHLAADGSAIGLRPLQGRPCRVSDDYGSRAGRTPRSRPFRAERCPLGYVMPSDPRRNGVRALLESC